MQRKSKIIEPTLGYNKNVGVPIEFLDFRRRDEAGKAVESFDQKVEEKFCEGRQRSARTTSKLTH